ncbi:hypothetical protein BDW69DRAFT_158905 [Aspergillus filifer]
MRLSWSSSSGSPRSRLDIRSLIPPLSMSDPRCSRGLMDSGIPGRLRVLFWTRGMIGESAVEIALSSRALGMHCSSRKWISGGIERDAGARTTFISIYLLWKVAFVSRRDEVGWNSEGVVRGLEEKGRWAERCLDDLNSDARGLNDGLFPRITSGFTTAIVCSDTGRAGGEEVHWDEIGYRSRYFGHHRVDNL